MRYDKMAKPEVFDNGVKRYICNDIDNERLAWQAEIDRIKRCHESDVAEGMKCVIELRGSRNVLIARIKELESELSEYKAHMRMSLDNSIKFTEKIDQLTKERDEYAESWELANNSDKKMTDRVYVLETRVEDLLNSLCKLDIQLTTWSVAAENCAKDRRELQLNLANKEKELEEIMSAIVVQNEDNFRGRQKAEVEIKELEGQVRMLEKAFP